MNSNANKLPVLFISHGAPDILVQKDSLVDSWRVQTEKIPKPKAILVVSAHWETVEPTISGNANSETIHDFSGFSEGVYKLSYSTPSAESLAYDISNKLSLKFNQDRGLDHAAWVPLLAMYPSADIPVLTLSVSPIKGCEFSYNLGKRLRCLREEGVLIVGSGGVVHNLFALDWVNVHAPPAGWAVGVMESVDSCVKTGDIDALLEPDRLLYSDQALPSLEHYLPLIVALGASENEQVSLFCEGWRYGSLSMHSYQFG